MFYIYNHILPFPGYKAITLWPFIFIRKDVHEQGRFKDKDYNHELIHAAQQRELLVIIFYLIYLAEYVFNVFRYRFNLDSAYRNISFEKEAYVSEKNLDYLSTRKHFAQWR